MIADNTHLAGRLSEQLIAGYVRKIVSEGATRAHNGRRDC